VRRWIVAWPERPAARSEAREAEKRERSQAYVSGGPMPPRVVKHMGRKVRFKEELPGRCLSFFSAARREKISAEEVAAAEE